MIPPGPFGAHNRDRPSLYRMASRFDPPPLRTRHSQPSWVNRAGRIDRSACVELRASDIWPFAAFATIAHPCHHGARNPGLVRGYREAASEINVSARFLARIQRNRRPRHLQGDLRTTKSNVMRPRYPRSAITNQQEPRKHIRIHRPTPALNPNKGAPQTKILGLWEHWSQTIRIERWRLHDRLAQHLLICPGCNQKFRKLFMPMCTKDEARDADLAEAWINQLDAHQRIGRAPLPSSLMAHRSSLLGRYSLLFTTGRRLVCRKCLGLRYGEVRAT